jgi:hypothetical protein
VGDDGQTGPGDDPGGEAAVGVRQDAGMRLDHVSYATSANNLADVVQRIGAALGAPFVDGGRHPRFGTRNFVLPLAGGTYLEVVSPLDHPAVDRAPFGQAVKARAEDGGGWLGWVVSVDDITAVEQRLGRSAVAGNRHRPDGYDLHWKQIGVNDLRDDPQVPFFIEWQVPAAQHPSSGGRADLRIVGLEIAGEPEVLADWLGQPADRLLDGLEVAWADGEPTGVCSVSVATANGVVRLD